MSVEKTIDYYLQFIEAKAGAIQIDADSKMHGLDWPKIHSMARDINVAIWEIRKQLGLHAKENLLDELTAMLDEHPEQWDGPCLCKSCLSL